VPSAAPGRERFRPPSRLRRSADFQRCYRQGRRRGGVLTTVHLIANSTGSPRLGLTASRKVGNAVVRNRLKRWSREIFRRAAWRDELGGVDLVFHFKPGLAAAEFGALRAELDQSVASLVAQGRRR